MNTSIFRWRALPVLTLFLAALPPALRAEEEPAAATAETESDATLEALGKSAAAFVDAFNKKDAAAIAAMFMPLGEIIGSDGSTLVGREEIESHFADVFAAESVPQIALEASSVQLLAPGVAAEEGVIHLTVSEDEPVRSIGYSSVHIKQADGSWLISSSRDQPESTPPSERIKPLHWLIGEWTLEGEDGERIDMVIDLDGRENHLLGEALITDAEGGAQSSTVRIGWNPATSSVFWWTFDSEGGNASGEWTRRDDEWIVQTSGVTADAEATSSTQTLAQDGDTMVWIARDRLLEGESQPDLIYRFVRRAPDPISLLTADESEEGSSAEPEEKSDQD